MDTTNEFRCPTCRSLLESTGTRFEFGATDVPALQIRTCPVCGAPNYLEGETGIWPFVRPTLWNTVLAVKERIEPVQTWEDIKILAPEWAAVAEVLPESAKESAYQVKNLPAGDLVQTVVDSRKLLLWLAIGAAVVGIALGVRGKIEG